MAEKNNPEVFEGFEALVDFISPDAGVSKASDSLDDIPELDDLSALEDVADDDTDDNAADDNDATTSKKKPAAAKVDDDGGDDDEDLSEFEPQIASFFKEKFAESFGMEFDEEDEFESVEELVAKLKEEVKKASEPVYANDEIKSLNDFVTQGGKLADYFAFAKAGDVDIDSLSLDSETDLKIAVKEKLRIQGYSEDRIRKALQRYENADTMQEEGEEAIDFLKEYKEQNQKKLLETQQKLEKQRVEQQRTFVSTVEKRINDLPDIKGYKISDKQKKELVDYIFKPGPDGATDYQRQYMSDVLNLIESAYFTKYGTQLISKANKAGQSAAYKDLHQKLKASKGKMRSSSQGSNRFDSSSDSLTSLIGKHIF